MGERYFSQRIVPPKVATMRLLRKMCFFYTHPPPFKPTLQANIIARLMKPTHRSTLLFISQSNSARQSTLLRLLNPPTTLSTLQRHTSLWDAAINPPCALALLFSS